MSSYYKKVFIEINKVLLKHFGYAKVKVIKTVIPMIKLTLVENYVE